MLFEWLLGSWLLMLDWLIRLAALLWIPSRTTPGAARSWLLLVGFVPLLGLPLYLLFGHPWLSRERIRRLKIIASTESMDGGRPLMQDPDFARKVAEIEVELKALEITVMRVIATETSQVIREEQALQPPLRWTPPPETATAEIVPLIERQGDFMPIHGNAVDLLNDYDASLQAIREPSFKQSLDLQGALPGGIPPAQFRSLMEQELKNWSAAAHKAGIKPQ